MSVTEVKQALGSWSVRLRPDTPRELLDALEPFGHIALAPGRLDVRTLGDGMLSAARYVGVYRSREDSEDEGTTVGGAGMAFWLGDEDGKGDVFTSPVVSASATFANAIRAVLPPGGSVIEGTLTSPGAGLFSNTFQYTTPRDAISYITDTYGTDVNPVSWRVNGNGTLDAGPDSVLFPSTPRAMLVRKANTGRDPYLVGLRGQLKLGVDVEDYTTKVVLLAEGEGAATVSASASLVTPYKDIRGNLVRSTRLVSEFETSGGNAAARALLQLNRFRNPRKAVDLSSDDYDVRGELGVGDPVYVHDPDIGFTNTSIEVPWRGVMINPALTTVTELTYPVEAGWTVAFRRGSDGAWFDLTDFYLPEGGATTVKVGGFSSSLTSSTTQPVGNRPLPDTSTPGVPVFGTFYSSTYQTGAANGETRGQVQVTWSQPLNTDGSTITDGSHYEIRYRPIVSAPYPATWNQAATSLWNDVATNAWNQPLIAPFVNTNWQTQMTPWGTNQIVIQELTPGVTYEFQIRAVDAANPPNRGAYSGTQAVNVALDFFPPTDPAAPEVAASNISIQVTHRMGRFDGGSYNLEYDLDHLEVHAGSGPAFFPDETTRVGKMNANQGMMRGQIPAVATFPIQQTDQVWVKVIAVDRTGNKSGASIGASATALLIDTAHISDLSVSKVTAGTISTQWLLAGSVITATSGQRAVMSGANGFYTYNDANDLTFWANPNGNTQMIGQLSSGTTSQRVVVNPIGASTPAIRFYPAEGSDYATIYGAEVEIAGQTESWLSMRSSTVSNLGGKIQLSPQQVRVGFTNSSTNQFAGGGIYADENQALVGFFPANNLTAGIKASSGALQVGTFDVPGTGIQGGMTMSSAEDVVFVGQLFDNNSFSNNADDMIVCGQIPQGAAFTTTTRNWGTTSLGATRLVACQAVGVSAGTPIGTIGRITTYNTTGFIWTVSASMATNVLYWMWRSQI